MRREDRIRSREVLWFEAPEDLKATADISQPYLINYERGNLSTWRTLELFIARMRNDM
jgi:hypothetical protein